MRERVFGLENEYGIMFEPARPGVKSPTSREIFGLIEAELRARYQTLPARYRGKRGFFLENGSLVTFETVDTLHGLLEVATPECRTARDVTIYQAAVDRMVGQLARNLRPRLAAAGFSGSVRFSKAGADGKGHVWGSHENYYVEDPVRPTFLIRVGESVCRVFFLLSLGIANGLSWVFLAACIGLLLTYLVGSLVVFGAVSLGVLLFGMLGRMVSRRIDTGQPIQTLLRGLRVGLEGLLVGLQDGSVRLLRRVGPAILRPSLLMYEKFLERAAWRPFVEGLTSFLVTRPVWCGAGRLWVEPAAGREKAPDQAFSLSGRTAVMRRVAGVGMEAEFLFDMKSCVSEPFSVLRSRKRLEIICGDAAMSERSVYLRMGVTGLLLQMIEDGQRFDDLRLADPMASLAAVAADEELRRLYRLSDGRAMTALDIQRAYLERAQAWYAESTDEETRDLVSTWTRVLEGLDAGTLDPTRALDPTLAGGARDAGVAQDPALAGGARDAGVAQDPGTRREMALAGEVDWITKRMVMREMAKAAGTTLEEADAATRLAADVSRAVGGDPASCQLTSERDVRVLLERGIARDRMDEVRRTVQYHEWSWLRLLGLARLSFEMRRVDLRWHEIAEDTEDYARLRDAGRLSTDDELERAEREAPHDTRAHIRGALVRSHAAVSSRRVSLSWSHFNGPSRAEDRDFADPLQTI